LRRIWDFCSLSFLYCDLRPKAVDAERPDYQRVSLSERSAARLAHQSGGLGVASSNLAAPTRFSLYNQPFSHVPALRLERKNGTNRHRSARIGAEITRISTRLFA